MDVKQYFKKVREIEAGIRDSYPVIISLDTEDGGKAGLLSAVSKRIAAQMIAEGRAVLASDEECSRYLQELAEAQKAAEKEELAKRVQVAIITESELADRFPDKKTSGPSTNGK